MSRELGKSEGEGTDEKKKRLFVKKERKKYSRVKGGVSLTVGFRRIQSLAEKNGFVTTEERDM